MTDARAKVGERPHILTASQAVPVVFDIWGGDHHSELVARRVGNLCDLLPQIELELRSGFLVNLRGEADLGEFEEFDERVPS